VSSLAIPHEKSQVAEHVTLSIGLSCVEGDGSSATEKILIASADQALYQAKYSGRNRTCMALPIRHTVADQAKKARQ
jgi:diguanylate cyclase (GGDEF)-like protein